jgi:hypothetical protein
VEVEDVRGLMDEVCTIRGLSATVRETVL